MLIIPIRQTLQNATDYPAESLKISNNYNQLQLSSKYIDICIILFYEKTSNNYRWTFAYGSRTKVIRLLQQILNFESNKLCY